MNAFWLIVVRSSGKQCLLEVPVTASKVRLDVYNLSLDSCHVLVVSSPQLHTMPLGRVFHALPFQPHSKNRRVYIPSELSHDRAVLGLLLL